MNMLSRPNWADHRQDEAPPSLSVLLEQLIALVRRQYRLLLAIPAATLAIGMLYLAVTPPQYTATATLLIDSSALRVLQSQLQPQGDVPLDTLQVGSQVEVLMSRKVALAVIRALNLADDRDFIGAGKSAFGLSASGDEGTKEDRENQAIEEILRNRVVSRSEKTYALTISYSSRNPETAAKVANAFAEAYIEDQLEAKYQTVTRASSWLQDRIGELKTKATAADRAVLEFKEKNKIVDFGGSGTGAGGPTSNRLIGEQQAFELSSQLASARASTGEAKARLERIEQVRQLDVSQAAVADVLKNEVITRLRNQYLDLSAREANIGARYGVDHEAAVNVRNQMEEARRNISAELSRIAASTRSDYQIAKTREENLERSLNQLVSEGQSAQRDRLGLAELDSSAKVYHSLYDSFLQRYMEAIQQQSFPITDARVISAAVPPARKSKPIASFVLSIAATIGLLAGVGIAALREAVDGVFRTGRQAEQELGIRCLSVIPLAANHTAALGQSPGKPARIETLQNSPRRADRSSETAVPIYNFVDPLMRQAADDPLSTFAEAFRAIKIRASLEASVRDNKVIGVTSMLPSEGKSTIASNLAALMADAGKRVVLVDADLRNPTLARSINPQPSKGWLDVLSGAIDLGAAIGEERGSGLALLPVAPGEATLHADEVLSSPDFHGMINALRERFDYVILDLPPTAPVVDVRAVLPVVNSLVFVVEWGKTRVTSVRRQLLAEPELRDRLLGVVLNKANLKILGQFEQPGTYLNGYYPRG